MIKNIEISDVKFEEIAFELNDKYQLYSPIGNHIICHNLSNDIFILLYKKNMNNLILYGAKLIARGGGGIFDNHIYEKSQGVMHHHKVFLLNDFEEIKKILLLQ